MKTKDFAAAWQEKKSVAGKKCVVHADRDAVRFYMGGHICQQCLDIELAYRRYNDSHDWMLRLKNETKDRKWRDKDDEVEKPICGASLEILEAKLKAIADEYKAMLASGIQLTML